MSLQDFNIKEYIIKSLEEIGFKDYTDIQKKVIKEALDNNNLIACSKTGSGKTHAFLIPVFNNISESIKKTQAVIMAPTKELAIQIYTFSKKINPNIDIKCFTGGSDRKRDIEKLKNSSPIIVIGTPGRINDYLKEGILNLSSTKMFVVDEADMTFENGFLDDVYNIVNSNQDAQIMVFSATIFEQIKAFMKKVTKNKAYSLIYSNDFKDLKIDHYFIKLKKNEDKWNALLKFIKLKNPYLCMIFANTKKKVEEIHEFLLNNGIDNLEIHGNLTSRKRKQNILESKRLKYQYIVCSDIAARGIDIEGVSVVLNFELPTDIEFYLHRSGRTGRNNFSGECYSFYDFDNKEYIDYLESKGLKINYKKFIEDELVDLNVNREKRVKPVKESEILAKKLVKKSNKVKPGYKKKYQEEVKKTVKKLEKNKKRYFK